MNSHITPTDVLRAFCNCCYVQRNTEEIAAYVADDMVFSHGDKGLLLKGKDALLEHFSYDLTAVPSYFELYIIDEQHTSHTTCNLLTEMRFSNTDSNWCTRSITSLEKEDLGWRIKCLHAYSVDEDELSHVETAKQLVLKKDSPKSEPMLVRSLPGGVLGIYAEKDLPLYFANQQMLDYLGYETQREFIEETNGLLRNCVYSEDWTRLWKTVEQEVISPEGSGEYAIEYRLRKKDGAFIWVHDSSRRAKASDGCLSINAFIMDITVAKRAQDDLLNVYNNIPGAVFRCRFDKDFTVLDANDGLYEFLGYTRDEFEAMGGCMSAFIHHDDYLIMADKLTEQLKYSDTIHNENRLICKDGAVKWISIKAQLITDENGESFFYCVFVDITEEKQMTDRIRELYQKELNHFAEFSYEGGSIQGRLNISKNRVENYLATSLSALVQVGDPYDSFVEKLASAAVDPAYGNKIRAELNQASALNGFVHGKTEYHYSFLRHCAVNGFFWGVTRLRLHTNPETGDTIAFFYTFDVTEQKMQETLLSRIAQVAFDSVSDVDIVKDRYMMLRVQKETKTILSESGCYTEKIHSFARDSVDEKYAETFIEKTSLDYIKAQLEKEESYSFTTQLRDAEGDAQIKRYRIFYIDKQLGRVCISRTDVTDVIRQEQKQKDDLAAALAAAEQANAAKSDFLSRMSHEIRTPMNAIIGMCTVAAQSIGDEEQTADCISKIGISSRFLLSLINDILDMSRIESGKMLLKREKIPMEEFLNGINAICYSQACNKGIDYDCVIDPVLDDYYIGDAMKLQQVLVNVLSNAIKFTDAGGKITFSVSQRHKTKNDAVLRFVVNDTGAGMSEDYLPHIFEAFSQESTGTTSVYGGTGLGLAISKNIVDMMDGKIDVRSIKGIGSEFTIDVKLGLSEDEQHRRKKKKEYNFEKLKTLVVDDDVTVCESSVILLKEMGIQAEWVDSGRKAVQRVKQMWGQKNAFDMILIDWKMPEMDGIETARQIRSVVGPDVTIIIITAFDWVSIENEAKLAGVNMLISKPMFKSSLVSAFNKALGQNEEPQSMPILDYDFTGKRVLLVEDNILNTEIAQILLLNKGFSVETAENGLRALELFSKSKCGYYDAILMDIRMPLMDGLTAANNIRHLSNEDAKNIPIIAMTANAFDQDVDKSKAAGMNAHLAKPVDPNLLYQTLHQFLFPEEN